MTSIVLPIASEHMATDASPPPTGQRKRKRLPSDERRRRQRASKMRWACRNRERVRAQIRELCRLPRYLERRRERYARQRQEKLAAGWAPNPRGRPRMPFASEEERAAYFKLRAHERYLARKARAQRSAALCVLAARSNPSCDDEQNL